ncbi:MAG: tRNA (adenosine(37)-N6)-threonylcarbamoyltransferase complex dimerization subunit type 1 TsaB [Omnitrophica bacterium RIFCSPLOWO2_01_FULL_45_10]|nr:MAG: tRNA (adenosine(37)-N6)-threonylcarbamoyltransferase complex dimerization subunit type 1 TsaB [Omnitrophica bacterium RIFCSPLOWO2_01_FULL_45_10]
MKQMKLLAIDTSTDYLSIAILDGEGTIERVHRKAERSHSSLLIPTIDRLLKKARLKLKDIDGFCISIGPGSFTGLRIGVVTLKGLAYALKKRIVAVPTLDVIAHNIKNFNGIICPVLDAKKGKVYACLYRSGDEGIKRISKYLLLPVSELSEKLKGIKEKIVLLGDAVGGDWHPRAEILGRIGLEYFKKRKFTAPEDLEPLYLYSRECDVTGR